MEMKVDAKLIRAEREKRAWSQEHLATVSGLGLRTVQRIEVSGSASYESVKAIAAALELIASDLTIEATQVRAAQAPVEPQSNPLPAVSDPRPTKSPLAMKSLQAAMVLALGTLAGTAIAAKMPGGYWWVGALVFAASIILAQTVGRPATPARSGLDTAAFIAMAFFLATTIVAYKNPALVKLMIPLLGSIAVGLPAILATPNNRCRGRRTNGPSVA